MPLDQVARMVSLAEAETFFFRIHSALCLDPQAGGKVAKRRVLYFLAALWAFAFRPLLGVR